MTAIVEYYNFAVERELLCLGTRINRTLIRNGNMYNDKTMVYYYSLYCLPALPPLINK